MDRKLLETAFDAGWWAAKSENIYSQDQEREEFLADLHTQPQASEGEAVRWFGDKNYDPTEAMIDAGLYHNHRHNPESNMIASFKAMMSQAEIDGLVTYTHPAPDALRVAVEKLRDQYKDQMRFCDIEPLPYFREFVQRLDAALQAEQKGGA